MMGGVKPVRNPKYLAWIRTHSCVVCGASRGIESSHTGPHGLGQKSPDSSTIPLCAKHHRTGNDSYHRLGPRKFSEKHNRSSRLLLSRVLRGSATWSLSKRCDIRKRSCQ